MKKLFITICCTLIAVSLSAQSKIQFGLRLSPVVSWANTKDSTKADYVLPDSISSSARLGLSYGLTVIYNIADNFGIQTGLHIVDKGYNLKGQFGSDSKENRKISTLEIPIALRLRSKPIGSEALGMRIRGLAGGSLDFNVIGQKIKTENYPSTFKYSTKWAQPLGASLLFGLGVEWNVAKVGTFDLGVSYHKGMTNARILKGYETNGNVINPLKVRQKYDYMALDISYLF